MATANLECTQKEDGGVGSLIFRNTKRPNHDGIVQIFANEQFDIGRRDVEEAWQINDLTVSTHHLRFRCVEYGEDEEAHISPMVYVRVLSSNSIRMTSTTMERSETGRVVSKFDSDVLLNHGDVLHLTFSVRLVFQASDSRAVEHKLLDRIRVRESEDFKGSYHLTNRKLGTGGQASVFVAVRQLDKRQVACKALPLLDPESGVFKRVRTEAAVKQHARCVQLKAVKQCLTRKDERLYREFNILQALSHPNIITLEKVFCGTYHVYIFQELIAGGDLYSYFNKTGPLTEAQSVVIVRQLLKAVQYLHENGIAHRDIKLENIMMTSWRDGCRIVLTDFGQARTIEDVKNVVKSNAVPRMYTRVGTMGFIAPEVLDRTKRIAQETGYSKAIDVWAVGCVAALLLTNEPLFEDPVLDREGNLHPDLDTAAILALYDVSIIDHGEAWACISSKAKSFVRACLVLNESQRLPASQALLHKWFTSRHYAVEIEAAYQRAIQDWKPRTQSGNLIEDVDTTDAFPTDHSPKYAERIAKEVKSHYFDGPLRSMQKFPTIPSKHVRTPLPAVSEDIEANAIEVPRSPTQVHDSILIASPTRVLDSTQRSRRADKNGTRRLSIEDLAPPLTQPPALPPMSFLTQEVNDSPTQSQYMLDAPSQTYDRMDHGTNGFADQEILELDSPNDFDQATPNSCF